MYLIWRKEINDKGANNTLPIVIRLHDYFFLSINKLYQKKLKYVNFFFTWSNLFLLYLGNLENWTLHHFRLKAVDLDPMVCSHRRWAVRILQFVTSTLTYLFKVISRTHGKHTCCRAFGSRAFTTCSCFIKLHLSRSGFEHALQIVPLCGDCFDVYYGFFSKRLRIWKI